MILIIFLPLLGVLIYLITQGKGMRERRAGDLAYIADVLCFAPAPLLERATAFRLGESFVTGEDRVTRGLRAVRAADWRGGRS